MIYCGPRCSHSQTILYGAQNFDLSHLLNVVATARIEVCESRSASTAQRNRAKNCEVPCQIGCSSMLCTSTSGGPCFNGSDEWPADAGQQERQRSILKTSSGTTALRRESPPLGRLRVELGSPPFHERARETPPTLHRRQWPLNLPKLPAAQGARRHQVLNQRRPSPLDIQHAGVAHGLQIRPVLGCG